ncbi:hypothetical protein L596_000315 [Steinernema carpocapsae]|uniref:Uncharacterized protein n=1 Tax=Steinernema carpocapsae TaxID=34508 RepID=A0A4U8UK75_STECR|nr:hypothetical protein L596_000315 [Steinernema carpocapsae]
MRAKCQRQFGPECGFTNGSFAREYFCDRESSQSNTVSSLSQSPEKAERTAYLHNQRSRIQRGQQYFSCNSMDVVASRRSNVSKEASNPSQKAMRKELYHIWTAYAHGVLGCNNRVEIPACVRKYIMSGR